MIAMILIEFLLAPTVPSRQTQNLHSIVPGAAVVRDTSLGGIIRDVVNYTYGKLRLGLSFLSSLYTANTLEGGVSFEPKPYVLQ
jgi:hypothetical protein